MENSNPLADGLGSVLVVSGDHDDADAGLLAEDNGRGDLHPWGVQHTNNSAEGEVDLVLGELGGVIKVHLGGVHGRVSGGEAEAPQGVTTGSVLDSLGHDGVPHLGGHRDLLCSDSDVCAPVEDSLGGSLDEKLGSVSETSGLLGGAVG